MRNTFDQYRHPENRLTHALASCLAEDPSFRAAFVHWATGQRLPKHSPVKVIEQSVPGKIEAEEEEPEKRGLPDAWLYNEDGWCLLVESKVASAISQDQIRRHLKTAERCDFSDCRIVVLSVSAPTNNGQTNIHYRAWKDLFAWILAHSWDSTWPRKLADYMTVAEGRMTADEYLKEGTLTAFTGIPFNEDNPYSYREAKRIIRLLLEEMRTRSTLADRLGADLIAPGRKAITGTSGTSVWDFLRLGKVDGDDAFTKRPHLTLAIQRDRALVQVTIPNGMDGKLRKALVNMGQTGFTEMLSKVLKEGNAVMKADPGASPYLMLLQRHYLSQRSEPITDALLEFDLRTIFPVDKKIVKAQPEWVNAAFHGFSRRRSNLQLSVGFAFPYKRCKTVGTKQFADIVERSWNACRPLLNAMGIEPCKSGN